MDNIIQIEIAQRDSESVFSNGDFINHLAVPVVLEEGDQIVLNKTFIDTTAEDSGLIDIDADITVKLGVLPYVTAETDEKFEELRETGSNIPKDNVDYFPLRIQSNKTDPDSTHNLENAILISEIAFFMDTAADYPQFGAVNNPLIIYYYDINDNYTEMAFNIPFRKTRGKGYGDEQLFPVSLVVLDKFKQTGLNKFKSDAYRDGIGVFYDGGSINQHKQPKYLQDLWEANGCRAETMTHDEIESYNADGEKAHGGFGVSKFGKLGDEIDVACSLEQDLFSVDIKQGQYTPLEMTTLLNNAFVQNYTNNQFSYGNILESVFLKYSIPYIAPGNTKPATKSGLVFSGTFIFTPGTGNNRTKNHMLVSNGGFPNAAIDVDNSGRSFGYNPNLFTSLSNNYVCGTDSIEIEYDDETSLFYWKQLHNPIYSVEQGTPVTQVARRIGDGPNPYTYFIRSKAGGVCFTSMYACLQSNPETGYDFWSGKLGFNVPKMTVSDTTGGIADYKTVTIGDTVVTFSSPSIIDGVHTTNAVHTIDGLTKKTANKYREIPSEPDNAGAGEDTVFPEVQSNNNIVIFAERSTVNNNQVIRTDTNSGYYLIEMTAGFNNTMVGSNKTEKNIHGIVNRYFNRNSYTSSTEQDSLVYVHRGAPLILSSIRSRILLPNRTVPSNIGEDNTIFLQVVKAQPPPQILQKKK